jgi:hypothetical protein
MRRYVRNARPGWWLIGLLIAFACIAFWVGMSGASK